MLTDLCFCICLAVKTLWPSVWFQSWAFISWSNMAQTMGTSLLTFKSLLKENSHWAQAHASVISSNCLQRVPVHDKKIQTPGNKTGTWFIFECFNSLFYKTIRFPNCLRTELIQLHSLSSMQSHSCRCVEPAVETTFWCLKSFLATKPQGDRSLSNCQFIHPSFGNKNPLGYVFCPFIRGKCKWDSRDTLK